MVEVYRIGITLKLVNEVSPALRSIMGLIGSADEAVASLNRNLGLTSDRLAGLSTQMTRLAAATKELRLATGGLGGGGGGHGGRGGLHAGGGAGPIHGRFGVGVGEAAGLGLGFAAYEGLKSAASAQQAIFFTEVAAGLNPSSPAGRAFSNTLLSAAEQASLHTKFSTLDVLKMAPAIAGLADVPLAQSLPFFRDAINFGETVSQLGKSQGLNFDPSEAAAAAIRLSHLQSVTDPAKMGPELTALASAAATLKESPATIVRAMAYFAGSAQGSGLSNADTVALGALSGIYMPGTRSGTSVNALLEGLMPAGGPGSGTRMSKGAASRAASLAAMGLIDPKTHRLYTNAAGDPMRPLIEHLERYRELNPSTYYGQFRAAFNERGARAAGALSQPKALQQYDELMRRNAVLAAQGGTTGIQAQLQNTALGQTQQAWANIQSILTLLGTGTLPTLTAALKVFNAGLTDMRTFLGGHQDIATALGLGGLAVGTLAAGKLVLGLAGGLRLLGSLAVPTTLTRIAGMLTGLGPAGITAGAGLAPVVAAIGTLAGVGAAFAAAYSWLKADEKGSPAPGRAVHPLSALVGPHVEYSGGAGRAVHRAILVPGVAAPSLAAGGGPMSGVRPPAMQAGADPSAGVFAGVATKLEAMPGAVASAIAGAIHSLSLTGTVDLHGNVTLNAPGFSAAVGKMIAAGVAHAATGLSGSGARPAQLGWVGPT
jgi:hypothetical protein